MDELNNSELQIENMIYEIRGRQVMLDSDLAKLYQVETKRINEVVRRNRDRFPEDFYFELTREEYIKVLRSQNATLRLGHGKHSKYSYSKILDIFKEAENEIIVIDGYADKVLLDIIRNLNANVNVILIIFSKNTAFQPLFSKYQKQYSNLKVIYDNTFHDRYFILDSHKVYHCGTSVNHAGSKTFSINILEDELVRKNLIKHVESIIR